MQPISHSNSSYFSAMNSIKPKLSSQHSPQSFSFAGSPAPNYTLGKYSLDTLHVQWALLQQEPAIYAKRNADEIKANFKDNVGAAASNEKAKKELKKKEAEVNKAAKTTEVREQFKTQVAARAAKLKHPTFTGLLRQDLFIRSNYRAN